MATNVQSARQTASTSATSNVPRNSFRRLKPELHRLATFRSWKQNTKSIISPVLLAKVGFSYTEQGDKVCCSACDLEISNWKPGMDPREEHMNRKPKCPFVSSQQDLFSRNGPSAKLHELKFNRIMCEKSDVQGDTVHGGEVTTASNRSCENSFIFSMSTDMLDKARTSTLSNWPSITPSAQDMAYAGWWYTNIADRVICIHCDAMFHSWNETDIPYETHRLKSPHCFFVRAAEQKGIHNSRSRSPIPIATENEIPTSQIVVGAVHADYSAIFRRQQTFRNWPQTEPSLLPSIQSFVDAGFFYTGENTVVRCFYCNGALRNWQASDDPKIEHARWFPHCAYIRQYIGENLYQAIQRKNRELRAEQNLQQSNKSESNTLFPWTKDEIDRMVKARLDLPVVEKLRQEGYTMPIIRKVFEMQLRFKKDDFKSDVDLRIACIILEKQVKLINGNENNILIPQNWLNQCTMNRNKTQSNDKQQTNNQISTILKQDEKFPTVSTVVPRPSMVNKTEHETLCLLCLSTERQIACLPCGHLTSCVACGHSLKTCPVCRAEVKAFVRIYA